MIFTRPRVCFKGICAVRGGNENTKHSLPLMVWEQTERTEVLEIRSDPQSYRDPVIGHLARLENTSGSLQTAKDTMGTDEGLLLNAGRESRVHH